MDKSGRNLGFYNSSFVCFPLPKQAVGNSYTHELSLGALSFSSMTEVPYGLYARLALISMTNLAFRSKESVITSFTLYSLLSGLRYLKPTGKQLERFAHQLENWSSTLISLRYEEESRMSIQNLLLVDSADFRLEKDLDDNMHVYLSLTEKGKDFLQKASFPMPLDALQKITHAFDFDTLAWLISSIYQVSKKDEPRLIAWPHLCNQFHITPNNFPRFKTSFGKSLFRVQQSFYPGAKIYRVPEGIIVDKSPLLTQERKSNVLMLPSL